MKYTNPSLILTFLGNDLEPGHNTEQTIGKEYLILGSFNVKKQLISGLKSSSDQISLQLDRSCPSIEDINATDGDIEAVLKDGETTIFTGFVGTNLSWSVTDYGEEALNITLESRGTRLFNKPFIETGKHFFDCSASAAVYSIVHPLGISIREGDERLLLQPVQKQVDAGTTCRELLDQLLYECNAAYFCNNVGELCVHPIMADTEGAPVFDKSNLIMKAKKVVSMSKQLRTYCGARVAYNELGKAQNYLIYRNTTGQGSGVPYCNLVIPGGDYFDGAEIYTAAEWSEATADEFREPTLIGAVNAESESEIVGSGEIVNIENLTQQVDLNPNITFQAQVAGGPYFEMLAHNTGLASAAILRLDLYADITYVKSHGVIRTQVEGNADGKSILEEELTWIHDKDNATLHANLLAQYYRNASSSYTFYSREDIQLGSVIRLHEDVFSGLDVYVLVTAKQSTDRDNVNTYTAVGITTFNLGEDAFHGTTEAGKQSGVQGPQGEPGASAEVQYAIGDSFINPPTDEMLWNGEVMTWDGETMTWSAGLWGDNVPELERGKYIWMRTRIGSAPWQYTRLTGTTSWDPENLGVCMAATPTQSESGLGLIPGDYFVAGDNFTEDGESYYAGFAYTYNGTGWIELNLTTEANARKASNLLNSLATANVQIPASTSPYSVWLWAKNFVAQNAVIDNLFSQAITILSGGYIKGGDRYDASGTIVDWSKDGFWFGANGKLMASLQSDSNGNTFVGTQVGQKSHSSPGLYNTAVGYRALYENVTNGNLNVAIGYMALYANTAGDSNVAIGTYALVNNTTGEKNIAIGTNALFDNNADYNIAIGANSMRSNTSGIGNTAIGKDALKVNEIGVYNTAVGLSALTNTINNYNTALGALTLQNNTSGAYNLAVGSSALSSVTKGGHNVGIGGWGADVYSATGHYQINLNDSIICLEFNAARQSKNLYSVLNSYFPSNKSVGAMGVFNGQSVTGLQKTASGISVVGVNGYAIATLTGSSTETFTGRTIIAFINPNLTDSDRSSKDCLST